MSEFVRTCGIGQPGHICGLRAIGMVAVQPYRDVFSEIPLTPGIVYLCKRHYYEPILDPSNAPSSPVETTEGETGTELRPCDSVALTWLEIGAATREGIAKQIESEMQFEGVRAQRVMAMCAGIARTWKP